MNGKWEIQEQLYPLVLDIDFICNLQDLFDKVEEYNHKAGYIKHLDFDKKDLETINYFKTLLDQLKPIDDID